MSTASSSATADEAGLDCEEKDDHEAAVVLSVGQSSDGSIGKVNSDLGEGLEANSNAERPWPTFIQLSLKDPLFGRSNGSSSQANSKLSALEEADFHAAMSSTLTCSD